MDSALINVMPGYRMQAKEDYHNSSKPPGGLFAKEQLLTEVMAASKDAILLLNDGLISECNKSTLRMCQVNDELDLIGLAPLQLAPEMQADGSTSRQKWNQQLEIVNEHSFCRFEWSFLTTEDASLLPTQVTLILAHREDRQLLHMTVVDILSN